MLRTLLTAFIIITYTTLQGHVILPNFTLAAQKTDINQENSKSTSKYIKGIEKHITFTAHKDGNSTSTILRNGILIIKPGAKATILMCHGFMCDKTDTQFLRNIFEQYNTMTFDFRGHGENTQGQCCSLGRDEAYDVIGAVRFIKSQPGLTHLPLIVYGFSMGSAASIRAQSLDKTLFDGAILDCPFDSTENVLARSIEKLKISFFGHEITLPARVQSFFHKYAYNHYVQSMLKFLLKAVAHMDATPINTCIKHVDPHEDIKKITVPVLIIGCINDDKVPQEAVESVYAGAAGYKRLWITNGRHHFDSYFFNPEKYTYKVQKFIENIITKQYQQKIQQKILKDPNLSGTA
ncbi:MAG: alpha/beta hydrolase [Candidatus Babeliaceae bacterium]|jgi:pimeloyl-ACP methyl ester carboxylesterase